MTEAMIRSRCTSGRWIVALPSVYRICGAQITQMQLLMAAQLYGGSGTVVMGRSAAAVWKMEGARGLPAEIASPRQLVARAAGIIARRSGSIEPCDVTVVGALSLTNRVRTLIDMSFRVPERTLDVALDQVLRAEPTSRDRLTERMEALRSARLRGIKTLRRLIDQRDPDQAMTESALESLVRWWLLRFGFPEPVFQYWVDLPQYGPARLDFAYPNKLIGVEADSYAWHSSRASFERDRARNSELASLGWLILPMTLREIQRYPDRPAARLERALELRE
jgi:very-short-patch-repair endonuclease